VVLLEQVLRAEPNGERVLRRQARVVEEVRVIPDQDVEARAEVLAVGVSEDPPRLTDRLQEGEEQRNGRRREAAEQPAARPSSHAARRPSRPTTPKTTNAGLTGAPYSGTAGAIRAERPITTSPPTTGAITASAPRTRRTARAMAPTTSQMRPGGKMREASFHAETTPFLSRPSGKSPITSVTCWLNFSYRRLSRGSSKTNSCSVAECQTSRAPPYSVSRTGAMPEAAIHWASDGRR